nr:MAK10-like protein [Tanacetum cinerariifolium]
MGDKNHICTLGDYSRPSHGALGTPLSSPNGTMWYLFDPTPSGWCKMDAHSTDFDPRIQTNILRISQNLWPHLTLMLQIGKERACVSFNFPFTIKLAIPLLSGSISTWEDLTTCFLAQLFPSGRTTKLCNNILMLQQHQGEQTIDQSNSGKLRERNAKESWALLEDLALYDNESWNDPRDFAKPVKAISLPQDVPSTSDCLLIKLENQAQRLMEAHLAPKQPIQVNKITSSCELCSGPHDTRYYMENLEQAFFEYAS